MGTSVWFSVMLLYGAWAFFSRRRPEDEPREDWVPAVTILKPLKGLEPQLYENLSTFCQQAYPSFQIVFGVADANDPAVPVVRELQCRYPMVDMSLVIDGRTHGTNFKVSNLINMYPRAKHDILVLSDSDIRVPANYLRRVVAPLRDRQIGIVTNLYRAISANGLATALWSLAINTTYAPQILVARQVEKLTYAFGASLALRRRTLEAVGGFERLANVLADDYYLGQLVASQGLTLWLGDCVVETVTDVGSWRGLFDHQMRRARTNRSCRPRGYFGTILTNGVPWAILNLLLGGAALIPLCASLVTVGARLATTAAVSWRYLDTRLRMPALVLVLVTDLLLALVWALSFLGNTVCWSDRRFRILAADEMEVIGVSPEVAAATIAARERSQRLPVGRQ
jgi:ceramide glucosyltransferase